MNKFLCGLFLTFFSSLAIASPDQINVVGLIPGVSTASEVRAAGTVAAGGIYFFEIGGYKLPCSAVFESEKLAALVCVTSEKFSQATNFEIHGTLLKGFSKKFGLPDSIDETPVRTRLGVEYQSSEVWWKDKKGNGLLLKSVEGKIDQGTLMLISSAKLQEGREKVEQEEKGRKF